MSSTPIEPTIAIRREIAMDSSGDKVIKVIKRDKTNRITNLVPKSNNVLAIISDSKGRLKW